MAARSLLPLEEETDFTYSPSPNFVVRGLFATGCIATILLCMYRTSGAQTLYAQTGALSGARTVQPVGKYSARKHDALYSAHFEAPQQLGTLGTSVPQESVLWTGNPVLATAGAAGMMLGAAVAALFQRLAGRPSAEAQPWSMTAVADANLDVNLDYKQPADADKAHLPPYAGKEPFRPDLFQPQGEVGTIIGTDIKYVKKRVWWFPRSYNSTDIVFLVTTFSMHAVAFILGPMTYRPDCLALAFGMYVITGLFGITLSYHRQLSHRSFTTPKWLEYIFAYCGVLAFQGDPLEWVASHRYHHLYCETDRDPHTVNEGLWWSHMGWLLDHKATKARTGDQTNAMDIMNDPFYKFIQKTYPFHLAAFALALYAWGGLPYVVWGVAVRVIWVWHITWFVNSASHAWGNKVYKTNPPDESRNNWWVGLLAWGEGWHNNHHAFQYSARHGLEWWQIDMTWGVIRTLQFLGLATNVKLPTEAKKNAMRLA